MKKSNFKKLALLGMTSGLLISSKTELLAEESSQQLQPEQLLAAATTDKDKSSSKDAYDPNDQNLGYHMMTEAELLDELNDEGKQIYNSLDAEGKELARQVASQRCQASNKCKGLNACQTDKHGCAGQGACQAQSKCAFADKNVAVKIVAKKMQEKRNQMNK